MDRFGWDCHGLPVEYEIDKAMKITSPQQVLDMGIGVYNGHCRAIVSRYCKEWETIVTRMGRWIDFEDGYKVYIYIHMILDCKNGARNLVERTRCVFILFADHGALVHGVRLVGFQNPV